MPIPLSCPGCRAAFDVPDELAGKTIRCTACRSQVTVPVAGIPVARPVTQATARPAAQAVPVARPAPPPRRDPPPPAARRRRDEDDDIDGPDLDDQDSRSNSRVILFAGAGLVGLLLIGGAVVGLLYAMNRTTSDPAVEVAAGPKPTAPPARPTNPDPFAAPKAGAPPPRPTTPDPFAAPPKTPPAVITPPAGPDPFAAPPPITPIKPAPPATSPPGSSDPFAAPPTGGPKTPAAPPSSGSLPSTDPFAAPPKVDPAPPTTNPPASPPTDPFAPAPSTPPGSGSVTPKPPPVASDPSGPNPGGTTPPVADPFGPMPTPGTQTPPSGGGFLGGGGPAPPAGGTGGGFLGTPSGGTDPINPGGRPEPAPGEETRLGLAARLAPFWAGVYSPDGTEFYTVGHRLSGTKPTGTLVRYSLPDFKLLGTYHLPFFASRAAIDPKKNVIYVASVTKLDRSLSLNAVTERVIAEGAIQAFDLSQIKAGKVQEKEELKPLWTLPITSGRVAGLHLGADGKSAYVLGVSVSPTARPAVKSKLIHVDVVDKKVVRQMDLPEPAMEMCPSADGKQLCVTELPLAPTGQVVGVQAKPVGVLLIDPAAWTRVKTVPLPGAAADTTAGPDGRLVVVVGTPAGAKYYGLNADTGASKELDVGAGWRGSTGGYVKLSADGRRLFSSSRQAMGFDVYDVTDAGLTKVLSSRMADDIVTGGHFHVSPDGRYVAFQTGAVVDMNAAGGGAAGGPKLPAPPTDPFGTPPAAPAPATPTAPVDPFAPPGK